MNYEAREGSDDKRALAEAQASVLAGVPSGTIVITREGETPVEWLEAGDEVLTRDRGFEPILWINRIKMERKELRQFPDFAPVTIKAGVIAPGLPMADIQVSPRQLMLIRSPIADRDYWSPEVLVPAKALGQQADPKKMHHAARVSYAQMLLASHQLIGSDGLWLGSLFAGTLAEGLNAPCPIAEMIGNRRMRAARPILSVAEGRALMKEIWEERAARDMLRDRGQNRSMKAG